MSMQRTMLAKVFFLSASVMVRSTRMRNRSVTARACQDGVSSPMPDCQIRGLASSGRASAEATTTRPSSLTAALRCS
jgi:hypothetical protein